MLVTDPDQPICVPIPAELMPSTRDADRAKPYYLTVGQAELEPTAPRDDHGASDDIYAFLRRRDSAIEDRIQEVVDRRQRLDRSLRNLVAEREELAATEPDTDSINEWIQDAEDELERLAAREFELR